MALMMGQLYDALRAAHVPEDRARAAAEEVAGYDNRIASVERKLDVLTWMIGTVIVLVLFVLGRLITM